MLPLREVEALWWGRICCREKLPIRPILLLCFLFGSFFKFSFLRYKNFCNQFSKKKEKRRKRLNRGENCEKADTKSSALIFEGCVLHPFSLPKT